MTSLGKLASVLGIALTLSACGSGQTESSDVANNSPPPAATNTAPVISGTPSASVNEGAGYSFTPVAYDGEGDNLSFSVSGLPGWASFTAATGRISGTPGYDAAGVYANIVISVSDGELSASLPAFSITVNDVVGPTPPVTRGAPLLNSARVSGSNIVLAWAQNFTIPEGGYDIFIDGVDTGTRYRTTATTTTIGGLDVTRAHCFNVESRYTNSSEFYPSNQRCSQAQNVSNRAPTISGTPAGSVTGGELYSFTPTASDADGDQLVFSVTNLPGWASFDTTDGTLVGTPGGADVGSYSGIVIAVSDGTETASLAPFSITVNASQVQTGSLSLAWTVPTTRTDGSRLDISEIGGYYIYVGTRSDNLEMRVEIRDSSATSYTIDDLKVGTYFLAVSTYDVENNGSSYSNIVEKSAN